MAEMYGTRPSELLAVSEPWLAFCLDEALFVKHRIWKSEHADQRGSRFRPNGFDDPDRADAIRVPWGGEGPDPLAASGGGL